MKRKLVNMRNPVMVSLFALAALWSACSDGGGDGGPDAGNNDAGGNDAGGDAPGDNQTPITARTSRGSQQCRIVRDRTDHTPRHWRASPAMVTTSGGSVYFARREAMSDTPIIPVAGQLLVGSFAADGSFGAPTVVTPAPASDVGALAAIPSGTGFAVVWVDGGKLRFGAFDANGASLAAPKDIAGGMDPLVTPKLAAGPDGGYGVIYAPQTAPNQREVHFIVLDATGAVKSPVRRLDQAGPAPQFPALPAPTIVAGATGYAMIWRDPRDGRGRIDFAKADASGGELIPRRRISVTNAADTVVGGGSGFEAPTNALIETSAGYLAAWTEAHRSQSLDQGAWATVQLARLDASGTRQGAPVPMRAPTDSIDEVEPSLVRFGNAVGVMWARGSHIYICAGCVPDHRIDLLLIDPVDLTPLSNVISVTNGASATAGVKAGGLLRRQVAVQGNSLLTTYQLTFHVHATAGSATFACDPT